MLWPLSEFIIDVMQKSSHDQNDDDNWMYETVEFDIAEPVLSLKDFSGIKPAFSIKESHQRNQPEYFENLAREKYSKRPQFNKHFWLTATELNCTNSQSHPVQIKKVREAY